MFKRREKRSVGRLVLEFFYPRSGWPRALQYIRHRISRLHGSPECISRGVAAGVFVTFSPLYGLHFLLSALIAWLMKGNIVAALLATFFGNPLTYIPIAMPYRSKPGTSSLEPNSTRTTAPAFGDKFFCRRRRRMVEYPRLFYRRHRRLDRPAAVYRTNADPVSPLAGCCPGCWRGRLHTTLRCRWSTAYQKRKKERLARPRKLRAVRR